MQCDQTLPLSAKGVACETKLLLLTVWKCGLYVTTSSTEDQHQTALGTIIQCQYRVYFWPTPQCTEHGHPLPSFQQQCPYCHTCTCETKLGSCRISDSLTQRTPTPFTVHLPNSNPYPYPNLALFPGPHFAAVETNSPRLQHKIWE